MEPKTGLSLLLWGSFSFIEQTQYGPLRPTHLVRRPFGNDFGGNVTSVGPKKMVKKCKFLNLKFIFIEPNTFKMAPLVKNVRRTR